MPIKVGGIENEQTSAAAAAAQDLEMDKGRQIGRIEPDQNSITTGRAASGKPQR